MKKVFSFLAVLSLLTGIILINSCKKDSVVPTLTTADITNITVSSMTSGGSITKDGGEDVTARGVCYSTSASPMISGSHTSDDTGTGSFVSNITGLTPNTLYHIRAYATNKVGTAYGNEVTATTTPLVVPTLTTAAVTAVTLTTAVSGGNITADGNAAVTARGVCWATTTDPTITNSKTTDGAGTGAFVSNLTGLTAGVTYYVRAYATNSVGTAYGNQVTFTTTAIAVPTLTTAVITSLTLTTAVSGGNITADGGSAVTARGVCWAATANPTTANSKTTDATGTGVFVSNITGLTAGGSYHVRAYATNAAGTAYGNDIPFSAAVAVATLTTTAASAITQTTATAGGNITADGGSTITARGVCWAITANPTITDAKTTETTLGTGVFTSSLTALLPGTTYHIRAYATNGVGTAYGNDLQFPTNPVLVATVTTTAITAVGPTIASTGGNVTSNGGGTVTARGICYSTTHTVPTVSDSPTTNGAGTGSFTTNLTGLTDGTVYYARAYATNSAGTGYGAVVTFLTKVADINLNVYNTVKIGNQIWMAENLKTVLFNTGAAILNITDGTTWAADSVLQTPAYCWYNNDIANKDIYGAIYNWFSVNTGNLCPTGWHVPTDEEYNTMEIAIGMAPADAGIYGFQGTTEGSELKSTTGWLDGQNGTNTSGFTALPGGYRYGKNGNFNDLENLSYWWTSSDGDPINTWYRELLGTSSRIYRAATNKAAGKYIRCIK